MAQFLYPWSVVQYVPIIFLNLFVPNMKKVLIVSFDFPPRLGIGGNRVFGLARFLPRFGWEPIVLTAQLPKHDHKIYLIESKYSDKIFLLKKILGYKIDNSIYEENQILKRISKNGRFPFTTKLLNFVKWLFLFPDRYSGWYIYAVRDCERILKTEKIDAIISSLNPIISHKIANKIKKEYGLYWIADYRDLWSNSHYLEAFKIQKWIMSRYEKKIISKADCLVTVSDQLAKCLGGLHRKRIFTIPNGFNPEDIIKCKLSKRYTIVYTGQIYGGKRDPSILFEVVKELIEKRLIKAEDISIDFYGSFSSWLENKINCYSLHGVVKQNGKVGKEIALQKQREAQILLLLNWDNDQDEGNYTGKLFEYISAKRPIISLSRENTVVSNLIMEANIGISTFEKKSIMSFVLDSYNEFCTKGQVKYVGYFHKLEKFSQVQMAKEFSNLLNQKIK